MICKNISAPLSTLTYLLSFWLSLHSLAVKPAWAGTALEDLAATMKPGTWQELATRNINPTLTNTGGSSNFIFGYTDYIRWDPVTRRLYFVGMDHNQPEGERFVQYDEATNSWSILPQPPTMACGSPCGVSHGYDHGAIDPSGRHLYFRYIYVGKTIHRYHIDTKTWSTLPDNNLRQSRACCGAIDYFPELGGIVWVQGGESSAGGSVFLYNYSTNMWSRLGKDLPMSGLHVFAEYNPVHKVIVFGGGYEKGGNESRKIHKMDSTGKITALKDTPFAVGIQHSVITVDPISGDYLVLNNAKQFWKYDVVADRWAQLPAPPAGVWRNGNPAVHGLVAGPVGSHGLNVLVTCRDSSGTNCHTYFYRHNSSDTTTGPSDNIAPSAPASLTAQVISSTQIGLSWSVSNDNVGVAGYRIYRNGLQVSASTTPSYQDAGLLPSTQYTYTVTAYDAAGNISAQSAPAYATTTQATTVAAKTFAEKCAQPGVINCLGFDDPAELFYNWDMNSVACNTALAGKIWYSGSTKAPRPQTNVFAKDMGKGRCDFPRIDTSFKASGAGALKFDVLSETGQSVTSFNGIFGKRPDGTFVCFSKRPECREGNTYFFQYKQAVDTNHGETEYRCVSGCGGHKSLIIFGAPDTDSTACCSIQLFLNNAYQTDVPFLAATQGTQSADYQNAVGCTTAKARSAGPTWPSATTQLVVSYAGRSRWRAPINPDCQTFGRNQFREYTWKVTVGDHATRNTRVEIWIDGIKVIDKGDISLSIGGPEGKGHGQFEFLAQLTGKDPTQVHPQGAVWYDDLIISTQPIAMSNSSSAPKISPPAAPSSPTLVIK